MTAAGRREKNDTLVVRKINKAIYNKFRERALVEHRNVGDALNQAMIEWLEKEDKRVKPQIGTILNLNGIVKSNQPVKWSEEVDDTLYGDTL